MVELKKEEFVKTETKINGLKNWRTEVGTGKSLLCKVECVCE